MDEAIKENAIQAWEEIKEALSELVKVIKKSLLSFLKMFKKEWAKHVLWNGRNYKKRVSASIYLRTKNKRIKQKKWKVISPF